MDDYRIPIVGESPRNISIEGIPNEEIFELALMMVSDEVVEEILEHKLKDGEAWKVALYAAGYCRSKADDVEHLFLLGKKHARMLRRISKILEALSKELRGASQEKKTKES